MAHIVGKIPAPTAKDKLEAIEREIKQRQRVYPRLIAQGKMTHAFAQRQNLIFQAIAEDYRQQVTPEPGLFNGK